MLLNGKEYPLHKEHTARAMRQANQDQLAQLAQPHSTTSSDGRPAHVGRRLVIVTILIVLLALSALAFPQISRANDLLDEGGVEPLAEAMTAYRVGHYYFVAGDYDRAIAYYTEAIDEMPEVIFEGSADYAVIFWDMGDAQFMAGQHGEALACYQRYLELAGDEASAEAAEYVRQLGDALDNGTTAEMTLIGA